MAPPTAAPPDARPAGSRPTSSPPAPTAGRAASTGTTVATLMSQPVLTIEVGESLWDAWQLLYVSGLRHLVVVDDQGRGVGVLSDRAVLADLPLTPEHMGRRLVRDVLARVPLICLRVDQTPQDAAALMTQHSIEAIPVLDAEGRLAGVVTGSDLVRWLAGR